MNVKDERPPVPGALAQRGAPAGKGPPLQPFTRGEHPPLSFAQERMWFLDQLDPGSATYNIWGGYRLLGRLDPLALEATLTEILRRHEVLRSVLDEVNGSPVQKIVSAARFPLTTADLTAIAPTEREAALRQRMEEASRRPFDLARGPLVRAELVRSGEEEHVLLIGFHHLVFDGWSAGILIREISALYEAFHQGRPSPLPELPIQYADFAQWQRLWLSDEALARPLDYWRAQLADVPASLELPTDHPRPAAQTFRGAATERRRLPPDLLKALRELARANGATLYMVFEAAFRILLGRYSGQEDFCVGTPTGGRPRPEVERLIGFFASTLAIRVKIDGDPTFRQLLTRVKSAVFGALQHQQLPFERLVEELKIPRDLGRNPLVQVMLVAQNTPGFTANASATGLQIVPFELETGTAKFDLSLFMREEPDGLWHYFEYGTDLFERETIERMSEQLEVLLGAIVARPEERISRLPLLSPGERARVVVEWNRTERSFPLEKTFPQLFTEQVARTPERIAVRCPAEQLTYGALEQRSTAWAQQLIARGVGPESVVALLEARSSRFLNAMLSVFKAGAAYLPLNTSDPAARLSQVLAESKAPLLLVGDDHLQSAEAALALLDPSSRPVLLPLSQLSDAPQPQPLPVRADVRSLAYVIFTSGSTGTPKGAMLEQRGMVNHLFAKVRDLGLTSDDVVAQTASQSFDISVWQFLVALLLGGRTEVYPDEVAQHPGRFLERLESDGVTIAETVPSLLGALVEEASAVSPRALRWMLATGEALAPALCARWLQRHPKIPLLNAYGPTECSDDVTHHPLTSAPTGLRTPIGHPVANMRVYVLDSQLQPVPTGVPGELYFGGVGVGRGYLGRPDLTAERFVPDPFATHPGERLYRTGDLGRLLGDGCVEFLGRIDHQVKVRGFRIELGEIEELLRRHPMVREAVVVAFPEAAGGGQLVAYWVPHASSDGADALRRHLRSKLPEYMVPGAFVELAALPLTANGKVDRKALHVPAMNQGPGQTRVPPRNAMEEQLCALWGELLNLSEPVGVADDFFESGGHSLLAIQLLSRIRATFQVDLPVRALFETPTVAGLAQRIESERAETERPRLEPIVRHADRSERPLSFMQQRLWVIHQMQPDSAVYNVPSGHRLVGALDVGALERAVEDVVRRHESLRTVFAEVAGQPVAKVVPPPEGFSLPVIDLTALDAETALVEAKRIVDADAARPFHLERGPLARFGLVRMGPDDHVLFMTFHHLVTDGLSTEVLLGDLNAAYQSRRAGEEPSLPPLPIQFGDYAQWQREHLTPERLEPQLAYWRKQLAGATTTLALPTDRVRPPRRRHRGAYFGERRLSSELRTGLTRLAQREGVTLFTVMTAAFNALLARYTGQQDISIGIHSAARERPELERLVGFFVNILVLRVDVGTDPSFQALIRQVRQVLLGAYANQDLPFDRVVEALSPERDLSRGGLYEALINLQVLEKPQLGDLEVTLFQPRNGTASTDLVLSVFQDPDGLALGVEYDSDLFDAATIERMVERFCLMLEGVVSGPQLRLSELPLQTEDERHKVLVEWNQTARSDVSESSAHSLLERAAKEQPRAPALVHRDQRLSFQELDERANRLAHYLRARGVGPDSVVGVCLERSVEMVVAVFAILKAGGAYLPLDPAQPDDRIAFMVEDAGVTLVLTAKGPHQALSPWLRRVMLDTQKDWMEHDGSAPPAVPFHPDQLAYVIYTSGSTGQPKGVQVTHRGLSNYLCWACEAYPMRASTPSPVCTSLSFDLTVTSLLVPLASGQAVELLPPGEELDALTRMLRQEALGSVALAPAHLEILRAQLGAAAPANKAPPAVIFGGEASSPQLLDFWRNHLPGTRFFNEYGPSETTAASMVFEVPSSGPLGNRLPIGRPIWNTQVYLLDRHLRPVPPGVVGELFIGGAGVARGYQGRADLTAERFVPNPFSTTGDRLYRTGDLGTLRADGEVEFLGRTDHQVKIRGFRIELGEIEAALSAHAHVREALVLVRGDGEAKRLVAYVVPKAESVDRAALREHLKGVLPEYMVPPSYVELSAFPLTVHGKIDRDALPEPGPTDGAFIDEAPQTSVEKMLASIWSELLGRETIGLHEDFFEIGGHSLLAIQVVSRVRAMFGVELPIRVLFEQPTIKDVAQVLAEAMPEADVSQKSDDEVDALLREMLAKS